MNSRVFKIIQSTVLVVSIVIGSESSVVFPVQKVHAETPGSLSQTFNINVQTGNDRLLVMKVQSDGKILIAGDFTTLDGVSYGRIARINPDGSVDEDFNSGGVGFGAAIRTMQLLPDGDILPAGNFSTYNAVSASRTVRLNSDGSIDSGYVYGTGFNTTTYSNNIDGDGKYLYVGNFGTYNSTTSPTRIARINTDGSLDTTLGESGVGFGTYPFTITPQSDGKILVGGRFVSAMGTTTGELVRLNNNGSLDEDFVINIGTGADPDPSIVWVVKTLDGGKILVAGNFTSFNGVSTKGLIVLNSDGSTDTDFMTNIGTGMSTVIYWPETVKVLSDGRIVLSGDFTSFNGTAAPSIVILNADGTLDTSFDASSALDGVQHIKTVETDADEEFLYVGGVLNVVGTGAMNGFVKLNLGSSEEEEVEETSSGSGGMNIDIDASCSVSDTTIKTGEEIDIEVDIEATKSGSPLDYTFKWTKILSGTDEETSHTFDTEGTYKIQGQVKTDYTDKTITCDTVTVSGSTSSSGNDNDDEENEEDNKTETTTDTFKGIISKYKDFLTTLHNLGINLPANVASQLNLDTPTPTFTQDLELGVSHSEVKLLQQFLNSEGYTVAETGPGSKGNETEMFGYATEAALILFQKDNNITPAVGYFGPLTRSFVNNL